MKKLIILTTATALLLPLTAKPGKRGPGPGKGKHQEEIAKRLAFEEEKRNDFVDNHTLRDLNQDKEAKDHRPDDLGMYTRHTLQRIIRLNAMGALEEADANDLKNEHARLVSAAKDAAQDGVTEEEKKEYREGLDALNDDINSRFQEGDEGDNRTPMVNRAQLRLDETIEAAVRTGRISDAKANSLRRDLEALERKEERAKSGELSTREREKLIEEALEVRKEIMDEILD